MLPAMLNTVSNREFSREKEQLTVGHEKREILLLDVSMYIKEKIVISSQIKYIIVKLLKEFCHHKHTFRIGKIKANFSSKFQVSQLQKLK